LVASVCTVESIRLPATEAAAPLSVLVSLTTLTVLSPVDWSVAKPRVEIVPAAVTREWDTDHPNATASLSDGITAVGAASASVFAVECAVSVRPSISLPGANEMVAFASERAKLATNESSPRILSATFVRTFSAVESSGRVCELSAVALMITSPPLIFAPAPRVTVASDLWMSTNGTVRFRASFASISIFPYVVFGRSEPSAKSWALSPMVIVVPLNVMAPPVPSRSLVETTTPLSMVIVSASSSRLFPGRVRLPVTSMLSVPSPASIFRNVTPAIATVTASPKPVTTMFPLPSVDTWAVSSESVPSTSTVPGPVSVTGSSPE
jgi:hypothetical protein